MIPVTDNNYTQFDLNKKVNDKKEKYRLELMNNQLRWLISNKKTIYTKSRLLYDLYRSNKLSENVKNRCCNYPLLEQKCHEYNNKI